MDQVLQALDFKMVRVVGGCIELAENCILYLFHPYNDS